MKKIDKIAFTVTLCMLLAALGSLYFLPDQIAVQWNHTGVSSTAPKYLVLLFPVIGALCMALHRGQRPVSAPKMPMANGLFVAVLLVFAAEIVILCNGLGLLHISRVPSSLVKVAGVLVGCLLIYTGNRLPKFAKNLYCGVKTPEALIDDDVWVKTQRFAAKLWVGVGLVFALTALAPTYVQTPALVIGPILLFLLPRFYSIHLAKQ